MQKIEIDVNPYSTILREYLEIELDEDGVKKIEARAVPGCAELPAITLIYILERDGNLWKLTEIIIKEQFPSPPDKVFKKIEYIDKGTYSKDHERIERAIKLVKDIVNDQKKAEELFNLITKWSAVTESLGSETVNVIQKR